MTTETVIVLGVLIVIAVLALGWFYMARQRRQRLRTRFGPEYERTVHDVGSEEKAEALLTERARRVSKYHIRELKRDERARFSDAWRRVQAVRHSRGGATTEDLRQALVHYRALFADLLNEPKQMRKSA